MTLVEFLLARIAEDEAAVRAVWADNVSLGPIRAGDDHWPSERVFAELVTPGRVLAECEAKRRIVEQASIYADAQYPDYEGGYQSAMEDVLALLALPYADHPDYDEAWRP